MKLKSVITVHQSKEQVWDFLKDPANLVKWDKNIDKVISTSKNPVGVGYTFDTIASAQPGQIKGSRMSYRIIEYVPLHFAKILLVRSRFFKNATWKILVESSNGGTKVTCEVKLTFRLIYLYLIPLLLFSKRGKLLTDLGYFKNSLENSCM